MCAMASFIALRLNFVYMRVGGQQKGGSWGDGSVGEVRIVKTRGPEFGTPEHGSLHVQFWHCHSEMGDRNRGDLWKFSLQIDWLTL